MKPKPEVKRSGSDVVCINYIRWNYEAVIVEIVIL